jgi:hypothetical protein
MLRCKHHRAAIRKLVEPDLRESFMLDLEERIKRYSWRILQQPALALALAEAQVILR